MQPGACKAFQSNSRSSWTGGQGGEKAQSGSFAADCSKESEGESAGSVPDWREGRVMLILIAIAICAGLAIHLAGTKNTLAGCGALAIIGFIIFALFAMEMGREMRHPTIDRSEHNGRSR